MSLDIKYLTDEKGKRTAVVISIDEWNILKKELETFRQQEELRMQIESGLKEIKEWKNGSKELITLEDFLENEC